MTSSTMTMKMMATTIEIMMTDNDDNDIVSNG